MADAILGQPFSPLRLITDSAGSPVTSGVTGGMYIYTPSTPFDTSTPPVIFGVLQHFGGGNWGYTFAGSNFTAPGLYRDWINAFTVGGTAVTDPGDSFTVGPVREWMRTLRAIYTELSEQLGGAVYAGSSTGIGTTSTLVDSALAWGATGEWNGAELVPFEQGNVADAPVLRVTGFNPSTGTLTFTPPVAANVASGTDYLISQEWAHRRKLNAIHAALDRLRPSIEVADEVTLTTSASTREYGIPADWTHLRAVAYRPVGSDAGQWERLGRDEYRVGRGTWKLQLLRPWTASLPLRIEGRIESTRPRRWGSLVDADATLVRELAELDLLTRSPKREDAQRAAYLAATTRPRLARLRRTNEVSLGG